MSTSSSNGNIAGQPAPVVPVRSEQVLEAKTDLCISNAIVKAGVGLGVGVVASAVLFRRRPWPVLLGLGFGFGQGYSDCERVFNPAAVPGFKIAGQKVESPLSSFNPFGSSSAAPSTSPLSSTASSTPAPSPAPGSTLAAPISSPSTTGDASSALAQAKAEVKAKGETAKVQAESVVDKVKEVVLGAEDKVEKKVVDIKEGKKWV